MKPQYIKITEQGNKYHYSDKAMTIYHREDGPAVECTNGKRAWFKEGVLHRENGPAQYNVNISCYEGWYINGKLHREYGPALTYNNGDCHWFVNGKEVTNQEHHDYFNPPKAQTININGKVFTVEQLNDLIKTAE